MMRKHSLFTMIATMAILVLSSCSTAEFDENLKHAFKTMEDVYEECNEVNLTMKKIVDTSFQKSLESQNEERDILVILSEMANEQYDTYEREGVGKRIAENLDLLRSQVAAMKNAPISRKNCYNDFMEIVMEVSRYAEETTKNLKARYDNPVEFSLGSSTHLADRLISDFKLKYADVLLSNP